MTAADLLGRIETIKKTALISECGTYRYSLTRQWGDAPLLPFVITREVEL